VAQDESAVTEAPEPDDALLEIDWSRDAASIARRVRAAAPYPGAWTFIGDEAIVVTRATTRSSPAALRQGEAAVIDGRAIVAAGDGAVILHAGRRVDDDDREHPLDETALAELVTRARAG
jgi:methionyl-tRNA formyltransferase